ncbi:MAG: hypothetical protein KDE19_08045 [Caldilineaceae bacterium]|nr:hypothetical protein [Caldilineaceae bacterium]
MNKTISVIVGAAAGTVVGLAIHYLFGAAAETTFDEQYQSRWDRAIAEGRAAAAAHEVELRRQFEIAKQPRLQPPASET